MTLLKKTLFTFVFAVAFFHAGMSFAALNLSVISVDGSTSLRLGRVLSGLDNKKQLRVRITATEGVQYQVFQRLVEPMVNEKGETLDIGAIEVATSPNSNGAGTLYLQSISRLSYGEQLVYTSGQGGPSDEFQIAYAVRPDLLNINGNIAGKIAFTLRPIGTGSPQQVLVNVFLEKSADDWKVSVSGNRIPGRVMIQDTDTTPDKADGLKISFSGNTSEEIRVYQQAELLPQNEMGEEMDAGVLKFAVDGNGADSMRMEGVAGLERGRVLLYSSKKAEDSFSVYFMADAAGIELQNAGLYSGKLRYTVEKGTTSETFVIDLGCQVAPFFLMDIGMPPEGARFTNVLPNNPPVEKTIEVKVRTNIHKPYQVTQDIASLMVNNKGEEIKREYLTFKVEIPNEQSGRTRYTDFSPLETGEYPIFSSNGEGAPADFKVIYRLKGYTQMPGGDFTAPIRYSLNQN